LLAWAIVVETILALALMSLPLDTRGWEVNAGFLILGALLTTTTVVLSDAIKRISQGRDLARALYVELANRVARCCYDYEVPWQRFGGEQKVVASGRVRKFAPFEPIIYPSTASAIALLMSDAPQRLIQFYVHLAAWQREVETAYAAYHPQPVPARDVRLLAYRLHQTLGPGLEALTALGRMVDAPELLDETAIAALDRIRGSKPEGTLRERLFKLAHDVPKR
jgi:hypothetical protein